MSYKQIRITFLITSCLFLFNFNYSQNIITSFEEINDLKNIKYSKDVKINQSINFPALGAYSCKVEFPNQGGEFQIFIKETASYANVEEVTTKEDEVLLYYIWTNEVGKINLIINDDLNQSFSKIVNLKQGSNHVQLLLAELKDLNVKRLNSITISSENSQILYVDYIAFDQFQPVLDELGIWDVEYATDIETPHYPWAKKFVNGTIKSYSISPVFDGRGIVELAQRLDLDFNVTTIGRRSGSEKYGYGDFYRRRSPMHQIEKTTFSLAHNYIAENLLFNQEMDVIIWPGMHVWENYSKQVQDALLDKVKNGTGLVLIFPISEEGNSSLWDISPLKSLKANNAQVKIDEGEIFSWPKELDSSNWSPSKPHYITNGVEFNAFPWGHMGAVSYKNNGGEVLVETENGNPVLAVRNYGKGRVIAMAYPEDGLLPRIDNLWETGLNYPYWEYMWSLVSRSVVWASGKEPLTTIESTTRTSKGLDVKLKNVLENAELIVQVTDDFGNIEEELTVAIKKGQTKKSIKFNKNLNGGEHIAKVILRGEKGVHDWYSSLFETNKIAEIVSIVNQKTQLPVGDKVHSEITINSQKQIYGELITNLYDNYGRLVDKQILEIKLKEEQVISTTLSSENIITNLGKIEVLLYNDGKQVDHKVEEIFFLQPRVWDDYDVTMYHFGPNPVPGTWSGIDKQLRELNVTTLAAYTLDNSKNANYKVQAQTRIQGVESPDSGPDLEYYENMLNAYLKTKDKKLLVRKYGLKDTVYLNSVRQDLTKQIKDWKKFSPSAYYIYEEPSVTRYDGALDLDFSEVTLIEMRKWLKSQYKSLTILNEQWGTDFKTWDTVIPDDTYEAIKRGNYSSWADHRTYMEICWADHFKMVKEIVDEVDPGGLVQLSGTQATSSHNGYDYSLINPHVGQMNPYNIDNQLEYHLTFNPEIKMSGQAGYGKMGKNVLYDYYHHLFLKETGGSYVFWQVSSMNPDLRINRAGSDMKSGFDELLKRGIGRLIGSYEPENELKIAIHYSYPSVHGAWIADGKIVKKTGDNDSKTLMQFNKNRDGWVKSLHDLGVGFEFIAYSAIETGSLMSKDYNVLILPMSYAISDKEVEQIEAFVKAGGILIADALPGVMDNHTKFRKERAFANLFGIKDKTYAKEELITPKGETDLQITNAEVLLKLANKSEMLYNTYGDGSAYLLNYFMDNYPKEKINQQNEATLNKLRIPFNKENLSSSIKITQPNGNLEKAVEKYSFSNKNETTRLLGLLPAKDSKERDIIIKLDNSAHLYNVRNKEYLGQGNEFKFHVVNEVPELLALLKNKIENIGVKSPHKVKQGDNVDLEINMIGDGFSDFTSVASIDVYNPKGERINYYSKNCDIKNGFGTYSFTTALNEIIGTWKLKITEVISGLEKEVIIFIQ